MALSKAGTATPSSNRTCSRKAACSSQEPVPPGREAHQGPRKAAVSIAREALAAPREGDSTRAPWQRGGPSHQHQDARSGRRQTVIARRPRRPGRPAAARRSARSVGAPRADPVSRPRSASADRSGARCDRRDTVTGARPGGTDRARAQPPGSSTDGGAPLVASRAQPPRSPRCARGHRGRCEGAVAESGATSLAIAGYAASRQCCGEALLPPAQKGQPDRRSVRLDTDARHSWSG